EKRLKDKLKTDRARIQVGRISGFGLLEMSRQRLRPGMIEATTQPCAHCHGTGLIRSDDNLALTILRQIEEEGTRRRSREVLVKAPVQIVNYIMNQKREHVAQIEARYGLSVRIEADPMLISPDFSLEKFKTATRVVPEPSEAVVSADSSLMDQIDEDIEDEEIVEETAETPEADEDSKPKKRRRRRRRRKSRGDEGEDQSPEEQNESSEEASEGDAAAEGDATEAAPEAEAEKPKRKRNSRSRGKSKKVVEAEEVAEAPAEELAAEPAEEEVSEPAEAVADVPAQEEPAKEDAPVAEAEPEVAEPEAVEPEPAPEPAAEPAPEPEAPAKPKRRGWWSMGR
ncbi:MAG: ribonuclease E/G, partial [Cognatishimia sp.]|uniref:ribonuclease E/G n=1 Tax=Cognatishimia sp. TaxID=2211648 RepID=UPI00405898D2